MNIYNWRHNFYWEYPDEDRLIETKVAVKTVNREWLDTYDPVVILVSVHSAFHEGMSGDYKMNALISSIRKHVNGRVTILFTDRAHLQAYSLDHEGDVELAFEKILSASHQLQERYRPYFEACNVVDWHSYVTEDTSFNHCLESLKKLKREDPDFHALLQHDAEQTYIGARRAFDKDLFVEKAIEDLLEQYAGIAVLANKGYLYCFYPGKPYTSFEKIKHTMPWIDVFLSIQKKKIVSTASSCL